MYIRVFETIVLDQPNNLEELLQPPPERLPQCGFLWSNRLSTKDELYLNSAQLTNHKSPVRSLQ